MKRFIKHGSRASAGLDQLGPRRDWSFPKIPERNIKGVKERAELSTRNRKIKVTLPSVRWLAFNA
jgi:hypothetical protein